MFYEAADLDTKLMCADCKIPFGVPKILPCGNTICQLSENDIWKDDKEEYKCPLCSNMHKRPTDGFPVNQVVKELCGIKPKSVYRGDLYENTSNKVKKLIKSVGNLKDDFENTDKKIRTYCDFLRDSVEKGVEAKRGQLNTIRDRLLKQIDDYEQKCLKYSSEELKKNDELKKTIEDADGKVKNWENELKKLDLTDKDLKGLSEELGNLEQSLKTHSQIVDQLAFFGEPLEFKESLSEIKEAHIGELRGIKTSDLHSERIKIVKPLQINYKGNSIICQSDVAAINDDRFVIAYLMYTYDSLNQFYLYQVKLRTFRKNGDVLSEVTEQHSAQNVHCLSVATCKNRVYLILQDQFNIYWLRSYDTDLLQQENVKLDYVPTSIYANNNEVYVSSAIAPFIHVYDANLSETKHCGQNENPNQPYFIQKVIQFSFKNEIIFIYDGENVSLIMKDTGKVLKTLQLNKPDSLFKVDLNLRLILLNTKTKEVLIYDWNGNLIDQFPLAGLKNISSFCITDSGTLLTNDNDNGIMNIY